MDRCHAEGGGTVVIPEGTWFTGTLHMRSGVRLLLKEGATLKAVPFPSLYPDVTPRFEARSLKITRKSLIYAEDARDIAITGKGTISGSGLVFSKIMDKHDRPHVIKFVSCRNVLVEGVRLEFAPSWMQLYLNCDGVTLRNLSVYTHGNDGCDGVSIDSSRNVLVEGCEIDSHNDAIAIKSTSSVPSENVVVRNCTLRSSKRGIKIGTESWGGFRNIRFESCSISRGERTIYNPFPGLMRTGINAGVVDGGEADGILFRDISVRDVKMPFLIYCGKRSEDSAEGRFGTVRLENVRAWSESPMSGIIFSSTVPIAEVQLHDLRLHSPGISPDAPLPSSHLANGLRTKPSYDMFGENTPASGIYIENVDTLSLSGIEVETERDDPRPPVVVHKVQTVLKGGLILQE